jgi:hypothetical protein
MSGDRLADFAHYRDIGLLDALPVDEVGRDGQKRPVAWGLAECRDHPGVLHNVAPVGGASEAHTLSGEYRNATAGTAAFANSGRRHDCFPSVVSCPIGGCTQLPLEDPGFLGKHQVRTRGAQAALQRAPPRCVYGLGDQCELVVDFAYLRSIPLTLLEARRADITKPIAVGLRVANGRATAKVD